MLKTRNSARFHIPRISSELLLFVMVTPVVVFLGLVVALGGKLIDMMIFAIVGGGFLLFLPLPLLMYALIIVTLLIAGTAEYFGRVSQATWAPFMMALALYARLPMEMFRSTKISRTGKPGTPLLYWIIAIYLSLIILTTIANQVPILQALVGAKSYMFFWSFLFLILVAEMPPERLDSFWKSIVFVAIIQLPFVLYQHFIIMKQRNAMYGADAVVGTFGGNPDSGGQNATLLLFMLVAALYATALYREGLLKRGWWLASLVLSAVVIAMGETKVAAVLIPLGFAVIYWDRLKSNFAAMIGFTAAMAVAIGALLAFYQFAYWDDMFLSDSLGESLEKSVDYIIDPYNIKPSGAVGRMASLNLWWEDPEADALRRTIGYGPGASKGQSTVSIGEVAMRYWPYQITTTAAAQLLWDFGVIGLLCFSAILVSGIMLANQVAGKVAPNSPQRAGLRTSAAALICMFILIPYSNYIVDQAAVQLLMVFCLAYVCYWYRRTMQRGQTR